MSRVFASHKYSADLIERRRCGMSNLGVELSHTYRRPILAAPQRGAAPVRALKRTLETLARSVGPSRRAPHPRLGAVSRAWLRQHEFESEKHGRG